MLNKSVVYILLIMVILMTCWILVSEKTVIQYIKPLDIKVIYINRPFSKPKLRLVNSQGTVLISTTMLSENISSSYIKVSHCPNDQGVQRIGVLPGDSDFVWVENGKNWIIEGDSAEGRR